MMFLFLYGGSNVKRSKNMFKVFSCLKGGGKEEGRFNDYEDFRREIREIGFLRALEMQGDKISGGLCGH
uniref:hypothetical protein n=1 Tax=Bartonella sp. AP57NXGY TaxID=3243497 RepID=UPI0035D0AEC1